MGKIAEKYSDHVIVTEDNNRTESFSSIASMILCGMTNASHTVIESREEAIRHAILTASKDDVIAIIGKGHEKYIINSNGKMAFDEKEIIYSALSEREKQDEDKAGLPNFIN